MQRRGGHRRRDAEARRAPPARCRGAEGAAGAMQRRETTRGAGAAGRGRGGEGRLRREAAGGAVCRWPDAAGCTWAMDPIANREWTLMGKKRNFLGLFVKQNLAGT
jgi:hypothetical protein